MATLSQLPAVQSNAGKTCRLAARCFVTAWPAVCGQLRLPETSAGRPAGPAVPFSPAACCHSAPGRQHSDSVSRLRGGCRDGFFSHSSPPQARPFNQYPSRVSWIPANRGKCDARSAVAWRVGLLALVKGGQVVQKSTVWVRGAANILLGDGIAVASVTVILGGVGAHQFVCGCCFSQLRSPHRRAWCSRKNAVRATALWLLWWMATFQPLLIRGHSRPPALGDADVAFALIAQRCLGLAVWNCGRSAMRPEPVFRQFQ